jgi:hypothetical protein
MIFLREEKRKGRENKRTLQYILQGDDSEGVNGGIKPFKELQDMSDAC